MLSVPPELPLREDDQVKPVLPLNSGPEKDSDDRLEGAGQAFEQHERELFEELLARAQRDIPEGATVAEAMAEMRRAIAEDDDARELLLRVSIIQSQNRGYIRSYFEQLNAKLADPGTRLTAAMGGRNLSREELDLMQRLGEELDRRLPPDLSEAERETRVVELLKEDEELAHMASRLERLALWGGKLPPHEGPAAGDT
jgi:hypothetical protein